MRRFYGQNGRSHDKVVSSKKNGWHHVSYILLFDKLIG